MLSRHFPRSRWITAGFLTLLATPLLIADDAADVIYSANQLSALRQYSAAESLLESALSNPQLDARERAALFNNLASVYDATGDYDHAEKNFRSAVVAAQDTIRSGNLDFLTPVTNLLGLYLQYGQIAKADRFARDLDSVAPGWRTAHHTNAARLYSLSGSVAIRCERYTEAEQLLLHAAELFNAEKADVSPDRAAVENNFGMLYRLTGQLDKALDHTRRAYDLVMKIESLDPGIIALILVNRAVLERMAGHDQDASQYFDRAMEIARAGVPRGQPIMGDILATAATYLKAAGRKSEAKQYAKQADLIRNTISRNTSIGKTVDYESFRLKSQ